MKKEIREHRLSMQPPPMRPPASTPIPRTASLHANRAAGGHRNHVHPREHDVPHRQSAEPGQDEGSDQAELTQIETAIESYKAKLGTFPPDNPATPLINQLYYELSGTIVTNTGGSARFYRTLDGNSQLSADPATFQTYFGPRVSGIANTTRASGDEGVFAVNFLKGALRPDQVATLPSGAKVIVTSLRWPEGQAYHPVPGVAFKTVNPWRYSSLNPTEQPRHV